MIADYHIHTELCKHASGTPSEYAKCAADAGLSEICFTDHAPDPDGYDPQNRMDFNTFPEYKKLITEARKSQSSIKIGYGIEADFYEGCEKFLPDWLKANDFDVVLGSAHYVDWEIDNPKNISIWKSSDVIAVWKAYFKKLGNLVDSRIYDVVSHIDLPKKFGFLPPDNIIKEITLPVMDKIAEAGMCIEINTSGLEKPVKEFYPSPMILSMAHERQIPICFGSDAHTPKDVGRHFNAAIALAKQCGYTESVRFEKRKPIPTPLP